jgi:hypothetical protein
MAKKNYELENTRPIFIEHEILSIHNLYVKHTFTELFKIMKDRRPISLFELFRTSRRGLSLTLLIPKHNLDKSKQNFVHSGSIIWNGLIGKILDKCKPNNENIMVPGSSKISDLSAPISLVKNRLNVILLKTQQLSIPGRPNEWLPHNHWSPNVPYH